MENIDTTLVNFLAYSINLSDIYILFFYDGTPRTVCASSNRNFDIKRSIILFKSNVSRLNPRFHVQFGHLFRTIIEQKINSREPRNPISLSYTE